MIITAKTAITTLLALFLGVIGLFLSLVIFVVLRIIFIYVEYCIVVNQLNVDAKISSEQTLFSSVKF